MRLVRARQSDPAVVEDGSAKFQKRQTPALDIDYVNLSPEALAEEPVSICQGVACLGIRHWLKVCVA
jgi:hypothetical protein